MSAVDADALVASLVAAGGTASAGGAVEVQ
jgi:hypothetical protein